MPIPNSTVDAFGVPTGVWGEAKKHCDLLRGHVLMFLIVLKREPLCQRFRAGEAHSGRNATFGDAGRRRGFILITGMDGIRYAVRPQAVGIIHDADECHDETLVQLYGGIWSGSRGRWMNC